MQTTNQQKCETVRKKRTQTSRCQFSQQTFSAYDGQAYFFSVRQQIVAYFYTVEENR